MKILDLTLPTPQQNLACDEALLSLCEERREQAILRFWESSGYFIVLGYSNKTRSEVHWSKCRKANVPVLRRRSGGGAVLQGPGCLNYSLCLNTLDCDPLKTIDGTYSLVMTRHKRALESVLGSEVGFGPPSDLTVDLLKFSGNAQYRRQHSLLFHGTFLLHLDIRLMEDLLPLPSRWPPYRQGRSHEMFLTNLHVPSDAIKEVLQNSWNASDPLRDIPFEKIHALASSPYSTDRWNYRL